MTDLLEQLRAARVLPVLRTDTAAAAVAAAETCLSAGLSVIELTATTPQWQTALREVRGEHPDATIGVGTVLSAGDAITAMDGGADFLVSPCPAAEVREAASGRVPFVEGGFTVAELLAASGRGVAKLFPAHVGGPKYLRSVLAVAPHAAIVPTGGIALADVGEWLAAGAVAVGVGTDLLRVPDLAVALRDVRAGRGR